MFNKLLPILLLTGCFNAPKNSPTVLRATGNQALGKDRSLISMYRSSDLGRSWTPIGQGLPEDLQVAFLDTLGKQLVIGSMNHGVYLSDPQRQSWQQLDTTGLPSQRITSLHVANGAIYAGLFKKGIFASRDLGKSWASLNYNLKNGLVPAILRVGNETWIGAADGIYALSDGSQTWRQIFDETQVSSLVKLGNSVFGGTHKGIISSSDNGASWDWVHTAMKPGKLIAMEGKIIATATEGDAVSFSGDLGKTWKTMSAGGQRENHVLEIVKSGEILMRSQSDGIYLSNELSKKGNAVYHFSLDVPFGVLLEYGEQWNTVYSRPEAPFIEMIVLDGVVYGGTVRGC